jgi:hypothetical protein
MEYAWKRPTGLSQRIFSAVLDMPSSAYLESEAFGICRDSIACIL